MIARLALLALLALPLGCLVRSRTAAHVAFGIAFAHAHALQRAILVMEWVNGSDSAFSQDDATQLLLEGGPCPVGGPPAQGLTGPTRYRAASRL